MKRALVTGVFGQDGSYLAELLTAEGREVHGIGRREPSTHSALLQSHIGRSDVRPKLHSCDLLDYEQVRRTMEEVRPDEIYHLAANHYSSEVLPAEQARLDRALFAANVGSTLNLLSAIRETAPSTHLVFAGSCLMYDGCGRWPQDEDEPLASRSVYGLSKISGARLVALFRNEYGLRASTAILYNHESPRRQAYFVTRKVVRGLVAVHRGEAPFLEIGNLDAVKDWGYARDYVRGMWLMAQANEPADYVLATGQGRTVEDLVREAADVLGYPDYREVVRVRAGVTRGADGVPLVGDPGRALAQLGWRHTLGFRSLVELMVDNELRGDLD